MDLRVPTENGDEVVEGDSSNLWILTFQRDKTHDPGKELRAGGVGSHIHSSHASGDVKFEEKGGGVFL